MSQNKICLLFPSNSFKYNGIFHNIGKSKKGVIIRKLSASTQHQQHLRLDPLIFHLNVYIKMKTEFLAHTSHIFMPSSFFFTIPDMCVANWGSKEMCKQFSMHILVIKNKIKYRHSRLCIRTHNALSSTMRTMLSSQKLMYFPSSLRQGWLDNMTHSCSKTVAMTTALWCAHLRLSVEREGLIEHREFTFLKRFNSLIEIQEEWLIRSNRDIRDGGRGHSKRKCRLTSHFDCGGGII